MATTQIAQVNSLSMPNLVMRTLAVVGNWGIGLLVIPPVGQDTKIAQLFAPQVWQQIARLSSRAPQCLAMLTPAAVGLQACGRNAAASAVQALGHGWLSVLPRKMLIVKAYAHKCLKSVTTHAYASGRLRLGVIAIRLVAWV